MFSSSDASDARRVPRVFILGGFHIMNSAGCSRIILRSKAIYVAKDA